MFKSLLKDDLNQDSEGQTHTNPPKVNEATDDRKIIEKGILPTNKLLRTHLLNSGKALTSTSTFEVLSEENRNINLNNSPIALSRPLSTYSTYTDNLPTSSRFRSQSVKDGTSTNLNNVSSRASSIRNGRLSRLSLVSNLNQHLLNSKTNLETNTLSDSLSDKSQPQLTKNPSYDLVQTNSPTTSIHSPIQFEDLNLLGETQFDLEPNTQLELIEQVKGKFTNSTTEPTQPNLNRSSSSYTDLFYDEELQYKGKGSQLKLDEDKVPNNWNYLQKHWLILSSAGKPIYTRYGDESKLSNLTGIIQAIISFYLDDKDAIRSINLDNFKVVFMLRDPLYYVIISWLNEPEELIRDQLYTFHHQLLSILTNSQLNKAFQRSNNFDLRRLLAGTEPFLDALCLRLDGYCPSYLMEAIRVVRMQPNLRQKLATALKPEPNDPDGDVLYVLLSSRYRLLQLLRSSRAALHPTDLHTLFNALNSSQTFKLENQTSYLPICFPKFNQSGYLYALITSIDSQHDILLTILSPSKERYEKLTLVKLAIMEKLQPMLPSLRDAVRNDAYEVTQLNLPGLRHFIYKSNPLLQLTMTNFAYPYVPPSQQKRLFQSYQQIFKNGRRRFKPLRITIVDFENYSIVYWTTHEFTLIATLTPYLSKTKVVEMALKIVKYVKLHFQEIFLNKVEFLK